MPGPSLKMLKPQHCSLKGKEILNINTVPLLNLHCITLQSNKLAQILFHKLGGEFYSFCIKKLVEESAKKEKYQLNSS